MIENTVFSIDEIKSQVLKNYNIVINLVEHEDRGSANIFYVTDVENNKYVFKEFESRCTEEKISQEAEIIYFLKEKGFCVPEYIKTVDGKFYFKCTDRIIILMKYIYGYTKNPNTGTYQQIMECANLHGKVTKVLESYEKLEIVDIKKWYSKSCIIKARNKYNELLERLGSSALEQKIKADLQYKLNLLDELDKFNLEDIQYMTLKNCHGDFSIMQFIYDNEKIKAIIDFERAKYMPISWEIIRAYTHMDMKCSDGNVDIGNLCDYVKIMMEYIELNKYDLKFMPYIYLFKLATSSYGYEEYINNSELTDLLEFGFWRTKICKNIYDNLKKIEHNLVELC